MPTPAEWITSGTPTEVPVTTSTPDLSAAPAPEPVVAAPVDTSTPASVSADATAAAAAAGATPVEAAAAGAQAAQDFIEGRVGEQPFQIPKGLQIPWKRGTETGFESIEQVQARGMFERDYRIKTAQLADQRRQMEVERRVEAARNAALQQAYEEQQARIKAAYDSPEEQARHEAFLQQYRNDPYFKKTVDDALQGRVLAAERTAVSEFEAQEAQLGAAQQVANTIAAIGQQYPDVDPDYVRDRYSRALQFENAPLSQAAIESIYREEAARIANARAPLSAELERLRAEVASIRTGQAADAHNSTTRQQITRATNPVAAPVGGTPPAPVPPVRNLNGRTLADRSREWSRLS
jgi:hypothetical protein